MPYLGNEPAVAYTSTTKDSFSGDGSTTDFTMSKAANVNAVRVVVENVVQNPTVAYTCSGTTIAFTSAPPTGTSNIYVVHLGPPAATIAPPTTINNATTFTGGVTLKNETPEDTDGGRESIVTFQGTQSGSEISTLAQIQASHDGTSDDEAGDLIIKVNDGNDGTSPSEAMRINSLGNVGIGTGDIDVSTQAGGSGYKALQIESDEGGQINFDHNDAGTGSTLGQINFQRAGEVVAEMEGVTDGATDNGRLVFRTQPDGGALTEAMRIDHNGIVTKPLQPSFLVQPSSQQSNIAANGNNTTIALGTERFDVGSNFSSNTFTAPVTGKYMLCANLYLSNIDSSMNYMQLTLNTSNRLYYFAFDTSSTDSDPNRMTFQVNVVADMDASDQSWLGILQSGGTAQTDVATESYFSGALIC